MIGIALAVPWASAIVLSLLDGRRPWVGRLAVAAAAASLAATAVLSAEVLSDGPVQTTTGDWPVGIGVTLRADALGVVFALTSQVVVLAALAFQVARGIEARALPAVALYLVAGLTGLFLTGDLFSFYVFFELSMISAIVLTTTPGTAREIRGAFVFAVTNLLGTFLFLIGVAGVYHVTGTLEMTQVAVRLGAAGQASSTLIGVLLFVALAVKLGIFPFHFWIPQVYPAARPAVAAILAGALANIGSYGLLRIGGQVFPPDVAVGAPPLVVLGAVTLLYGGVMAVACARTSETLAYSAVAQVGFVLVAIGIGGEAGVAAAVVYAVVNALNKLLLFLSAELGGALVGAAFLVGVLSVAGVPPSAGFVSKLAVLRAAIEDGSPGLVALVVVGTALSFLYLLRVFQRDRWADEGPERAAGAGERAVLVAVAALVLALGAWPEPLLFGGLEAGAEVGGGPS